jgi:ubiquinone/menaquinone biosynthesis C-methylase UbiE
MRAVARRHGIQVVGGVAEALPFGNAQFDSVLMVTTICFLDDTAAAVREAYRVLRPGSSLIIGMIDRNSQLGRTYERLKDENVFYREATFYSVGAVISYLNDVGFKHFAFTQTIFQDSGETKHIQPVSEGFGEGSFAVVRGVK